MIHSIPPDKAVEIFSKIKTDCFHFLGDRPCQAHIRSGKTCSCDEYLPIKRRGVIIKLGAQGDVLRTTTLLRALDPLQTGTKILWITHFPEFIPKDVCEVVRPDVTLLSRLMATEWDFCWNLDKDIEACSLARMVKAKEYAGYTLNESGVCLPVDERSWHKYATGIDNPYSQSNALSYPQEIFQIVGLDFSGEEYWLREPSLAVRTDAEGKLPGKGWIGLNTGAASRWTARIWPEDLWLELIGILQKQGMKPLLLGGPEEDILNRRLSEKTQAVYYGVQSLESFHALIERCDCMVSAVTMAFHIAIAAKIPLVLINNIFNPREFELYGRGEVLGPHSICDCYFGAKCRTGRECIREITPLNVFAAIKRSLL